MGRRKCVICNEWIEDNNDSVPFKDRYAHKNCFNIIMLNNVKEHKNSQKAKSKKTSPKSRTPAAELKEALSEEEYKSKKEFYAKVKELENITSLDARIYAISESYIKKYDFTWEGMCNALKYNFEVLNRDKSTECIRVIPYCYSEAAKFYNQIKEAVDDNDKALNGSVITIGQTITWRKKLEDQSELIDIDKIGCD